MGTESQDAEAKMFQAPADKGNLYIYRDENYGAAIRMSILLNNQLLSDTVAKSYIYQQLEVRIAFLKL